MKALANQFSTSGFSGAVATPTCSSCCCCCCCCLTTVTAGATVVGKRVSDEARKNKVARANKIWAIVLAASAPLLAIGVVILFSISGLMSDGFDPSVVSLIGGIALLLCYSAAYKLAGATNIWGSSIFYTIAIVIWTVVEVMLGAAMILGGYGIAYLVIAIVVSGAICMTYMTKKTKQSPRVAGKK